MRTCAALVMFLAIVAPAHAEMKYFQIARLLNFKTDCEMDAMEDRSPPAGPGRFFAACRNITFYPDGIELECPDRSDEWTCVILTKPTHFDALDMLRQKRASAPRNTKVQFSGDAMPG